MTISSLTQLLRNIHFSPIEKSKITWLVIEDFLSLNLQSISFIYFQGKIDSDMGIQKNVK
jgi:hypothetical protein